MQDIERFVKAMCSNYGVKDESVSLASQYHEPIGKCPKCGGDIIGGKYGFYCKVKCGMSVGNVYGVKLSSAQVKYLLNGKSTSIFTKGRRSVIYPEIEETTYKGRTYFQWKAVWDKK